MALGSTFHVPTDYTFASNFQIIIMIVLTDITKTYSISVMYRQPTTLFYINTARQMLMNQLRQNVIVNPVSPHSHYL